MVLMLVTKLDIIPLDAMTMYCKDNDAIAFAKEPRSHQKLKHIERRLHNIHDYLEKKHVEV